ncbi:MAG: universal stress protein [Chloroflexota bacterium]
MTEFYHRVLVPLDGSGLAEAALPLVSSLSGKDADLILLHVLERKAPEAIHGDRHLHSLEESEAYLERVAETLRAQGLSVQTHAHEVPEGDVARSIVAHAGEANADLIVLARHGGAGVRQMLFGTIAQHVLGTGSAPVLLIRPEVIAPSTLSAAGTILVPIDGSEESEEALRPAASVARSIHAPIRLVTVVPTVETLPAEQGATATLLPAGMRAALDLEQHEAEEHLEGLARRLRSEGIPVSTAVHRGSVPGRLRAEATEPDVGLIVLATHGHAGVQALMAGSVTAPLLSHARAPVLLLRLPGKD